MSGFISSLKLVMVCQVIIGISLFLPLTDSYAKSGCCSRHGGVAGCNTATGYQLCKDNSSSPSCKCEAKTGVTPVKKTKEKPSTNIGTTNPTTTNTPAPAAGTAATAATAATATTTSKAKTKGCCARHGGVDKCDTVSGYQMCKDGTHSSTCKCT
jgi:hypothetical protein